MIHTGIAVGLLEAAVGDDFPVLWLLPLLLAWPATLTVVVAFPNVRRELKALATRDDLDLQGLATYMLLFGILGGLCALLVAGHAGSRVRTAAWRLGRVGQRRPGPILRCPGRIPDCADPAGVDDLDRPAADACSRDTSGGTRESLTFSNLRTAVHDSDQYSINARSVLGAGWLKDGSRCILAPDCSREPIEKKRMD